MKRGDIFFSKKVTIKFAGHFFILLLFFNESSFFSKKMKFCFLSFFSLSLSLSLYTQVGFFLV